MSHDRTKPLYPTNGPEDGTGRDWRQFFRDVKGRDVVVDPVESDDDLPEPITIVVPAHEVSEGWPSALNTWRNRLLANDWQVKVGQAVADWEDQYHKNGNLKKAAHQTEAWWINAAKPGRYVTIYYLYADGKAVGQRTSRTIRGIMRLLTDAEMKDAVEADD